MAAKLHARTAHAHSKAGEPTEAWRQIDAAFDAYDKADVPEADLQSMYWINHGVMRSANLFQPGGVSTRHYCLAA
ncbi:hypothetical protein [Streptomyces blastmyceticus]|uniref:Uncharacterized protein n=1 Tax=Streptomyces blastmyceticus TaxID=68180 RepID=A0ABP3GJ81_9ACTN